MGISVVLRGPLVLSLLYLFFLKICSKPSSPDPQTRVNERSYTDPGLVYCHALQHYCERALCIYVLKMRVVAGKLYNMLSYSSQESDATVFLSSSSRPRIGMYQFLDTSD